VLKIRKLLKKRSAEWGEGMDPRIYLNGYLKNNMKLLPTPSKLIITNKGELKTTYNLSKKALEKILNDLM
jgi:hypothetical protein